MYLHNMRNLSRTVAYYVKGLISRHLKLAWQVKSYRITFEIFSRKTVIILQKHISTLNF